MEEMKLEYNKPTIRVVECDYNESICNNIITNSINTCLWVEKKTSVNVQENRLEITGNWEWTRSGSR